MTRRSAIKIAALSTLAADIAKAAAPKGRIKQSVARWCYKEMSMDDLCRNGAEMGLSAIDLVAPEDWPTVKKYGLVSSMVYSAGTIPDGWNRKESHDRLVKEMQEGIERAAAAKLPNVITFSGNRRGMSDDDGKENCIIGLRRVSKMAEDNNIIIIPAACPAATSSIKPRNYNGGQLRKPSRI
jgi:hydroxypyruvate isomerase